MEQQPNKRLTLTVGLPRSGKSTWALKQGVPVVNPDSIRLALHGQAYLQDAEQMVWTIALYMVKSLFLAGHERVIVDAVNATKHRRDFWENALWSVDYMPFNTPPDTCIERAISGGRPELVPVIKRMDEAFEPIE